MEKLDHFDFSTQVREFGKKKYDWDAILNGSIMKLERGSDYECKEVTIMAMARAQAKKRGIKVRIAKTKDGMVLQAVIEGAAKTNGEAAKQQQKTNKRK